MKAVLAFVLSVLPGLAGASDWLSVGGFSYHMNHCDCNAVNLGVGYQHRWQDWSIALGEYRNSNRETTRYVLGAWQPISVWKFRLGLTFGAVDGYRSVNNGGPFPIVLPAASLEIGRVGVDFFAAPRAGTASSVVAANIRFRL